MTTRYWIDGKTIKSGEGELTKNNDFVIDGGAFGKHRILYGHHYATKQEAFDDFCSEIDEKIKNLKDEVEVLRAKL